MKALLLILLIPLLPATIYSPLINLNNHIDLLPRGIIRHDVNIEKYRELGKQPKFECVARYSINDSIEDYATGVLVSPSWVLTAGHFLQDSSVWFIGGQYYKSKRTIKHPLFKSKFPERKHQFDGWDMALVQLEVPVLNVKPAIRHRDKMELGQVMYKIGYGWHGDGVNGETIPYIQNRLGGTNTIDSIGGLVGDLDISTDVLLADFDSPDTPQFNVFGSAIPQDLEIGASKGDSGGGIFIEYNGDLELVGIVSGGLSRLTTYGSMMSMSRVSSANEWIDSIINSPKK